MQVTEQFFVCLGIFFSLLETLLSRSPCPNCPLTILSSTANGSFHCCLFIWDFIIKGISFLWENAKQDHAPFTSRGRTATPSATVRLLEVRAWAWGPATQRPFRTFWVLSHSLRGAHCAFIFYVALYFLRTRTLRLGLGSECVLVQYGSPSAEEMLSWLPVGLLLINRLVTVLPSNSVYRFSLKWWMIMGARAEELSPHLLFYWRSPSSPAPSSQPHRTKRQRNEERRVYSSRVLFLCGEWGEGCGRGLHLTLLVSSAPCIAPSIHQVPNINKY